MTTRRGILWSVLVWFLWMVPFAWAQGTLPGFTRPLVAYDFEKVAVSTVAVGLTASKVTPTAGRAADFLQVSVETAQIRCVTDGSTPTATTGHRFYPDERFVLYGHPQIAALKCIRETGVDGVLVVTFYRIVE